MLTWALSSDAKPLASGLAAMQVDECLAGAVDSIGSSRFGHAALLKLNEAVPVDFWSAYRLYPDRPPRMFVSGSLKGRDVSGDCFRRYREGLYRQDKTFSGARDIASTGSQAMTYWNEAEIPSPHRDQIYRRHGIRERLSAVAGCEAEGLLAVNLYRFQSSACYLDREIDAVQSLARGLLACVRKHVEFIDRLGAGSGDPRLDAAHVLGRLCPALTRREIEVCERLLRGWTYEGIARDLGLSLTSVKTYRARAFDRLGIHFRNELFALAFTRA